MRKKTKAVLVVDAGNGLTRTKGWSDKPSPQELKRRWARADLILRFYEYVGAAAVAIGPEDLALGLQTVRRLLAAHERLPFLSANLADARGRKLLPGSRLVETPLGKVGFVAAGLPTKPRWRRQPRPWDNPKGIQWLDPARELPPLVRDLRSKGAKLVVLLAAMGRNQVQKLVQAVPGIDFALVADHGFWSGKSQQAGSTSVVGIPPGGKHIGVLELHVVQDHWTFQDRSGIPSLKERIRIMVRNWKRYAQMASRMKDEKVRQRYQARVDNLRRTVARQLEKLLAEARPAGKGPRSFFIHRVVGLDAKVGQDPKIQAMVDQVKQLYGIDDSKRRRRRVNKRNLLMQNLRKARQALELQGLPVRRKLRLRKPARKAR